MEKYVWLLAENVAVGYLKKCIWQWNTEAEACKRRSTAVKIFILQEVGKNIKLDYY